MPDDASADHLKRIADLIEAEDALCLARFVCGDFPLRVRMTALESLLLFEDAEALIACSDVLAEETETLARPLIGPLAAIPGDDGLLALAKGLSSPNMFTRSRTVRALAKRPEPSVFSYLIRACRDKQETVSQSGRQLLSRRVSENPEQLSLLRPETLDGVIEELPFEEVKRFLPRHTDAEVRQAAIRRMGTYHRERAVNYLISTVLAGEQPFADTAMEALRCNPSVTAEHIQQILDWGDEAMHGKAFALFAQRATRRGVEYLTEGLGDEDPAVRRASVENLFRLFGTEIVPVLMPLLEDKKASVCRAVLEAIAGAPRQLVERPLIHAATKGTEAIRSEALMAAAAQGICTPELMSGYLAHLDEKIQDPHPEGQKLDDICNIMTALKPARPTYLLVHLIQGATSASPRLRRKSIEVLEAYGREYRNEAFVYLAGSSDAHIVMTVAFALAEDKHPGAMMPLIRVAMGRKRKEARQAREYLRAMPELHDIERVCELVRSPHPTVRQYAINRLKEMGDPAAVALLLQAMEEGNEELQQQALARLVELGNVEAEEIAETGEVQAIDQERLREMSEDADPRAIDMLLQAAEDEDEAVQYAAVEALGKYVQEERVRKRLIDFLAYGSVPVRQLAVQTLGDNKVTEAVDALITALGNIFLRSYAEEALRKLGDRRGYLAVVRRRKREKMFPNRAKLEREKLKTRYGAKPGKGGRR